MGDLWLLRLPYLQTFTAERAAYRNLANGLKPPLTATSIRRSGDTIIFSAMSLIFTCRPAGVTPQPLCSRAA